MKKDSYFHASAISKVAFEAHYDTYNTKTEEISRENVPV